MSSYPGPGPVEEQKPSFLRRPVPMWAFLLLVVIIVLILFVPVLFTPTTPTIQQPLILTPDTRTVCISLSVSTCIRPGATNTTSFTVGNLNTTNTISATATVTASLILSNMTQVSANTNLTLTISGVQTRNAFVSSSDGKSVSFPPGVSLLMVSVAASPNATPGNYAIRVSLTD